MLNRGCKSYIFVTASLPVALMVRRAARFRGALAQDANPSGEPCEGRSIHFWEITCPSDRRFFEHPLEGPCVVFGEHARQLAASEILRLALVMPRIPSFDEVVGIIDHFSEDPVHRSLSAFVKRFSLSKREAEALRYGVSGMHGKAAAGEMGCSVSTVDVYWHRICAKVKCRGRDEAVALFFSEFVGFRPLGGSDDSHADRYPPKPELTPRGERELHARAFESSGRLHAGVRGQS